MPEVVMVRVFMLNGKGGNPAPIVVDAEGMSDLEMQGVTKQYGLESAFVLPPEGGGDLRLRFFVPRHEMEMCAHAPLGAVWLLDRYGKLPTGEVRIETRSGLVRALREGACLTITQPEGRVKPLPTDAVSATCHVLRLDPGDLAGFPVQNAATSRVKTLVPLADVERLHSLAPDWQQIEPLCEMLGSTGLYPYASGETFRVWHTRQFPKASGYPEDAATGIAASALAYGLKATGNIDEDQVLLVRQGEAMGRPSEIHVRLLPDKAGCLLSGSVLEYGS